MPWQIEIGSSFLFHCSFVGMLPVDCAFSHAELPNLAGFLGLKLRTLKWIILGLLSSPQLPDSIKHQIQIISFHEYL